MNPDYLKHEGINNVFHSSTEGRNLVNKLPDNHLEAIEYLLKQNLELIKLVDRLQIENEELKEE